MRTRSPAHAHTAVRLHAPHPLPIHASTPRLSRARSVPISDRTIHRNAARGRATDGLASRACASTIKVPPNASHRHESAIVAHQLWLLLAASLVSSIASADGDRASEIDEVAKTALRAAHGLPDVFELLACTRRRSILVRSLHDDGRRDRVLPEVDGATTWRVSSGQGDTWVKLLDRPGGRPGLTATLQRRGADQYAALFDAGACGSHELLVNRSPSRNWQAELRPSRLHDHAHALLRKAATVRARQAKSVFGCLRRPLERAP